MQLGDIAFTVIHAHNKKNSPDGDAHATEMKSCMICGTRAPAPPGIQASTLISHTHPHTRTRDADVHFAHGAKWARGKRARVRLPAWERGGGKGAGCGGIVGGVRSTMSSAHCVFALLWVSCQLENCRCSASVHTRKYRNNATVKNAFTKS